MKEFKDVKMLFDDYYRKVQLMKEAMQERCNEIREICISQNHTDKNGVSHVTTQNVLAGRMEKCSLCGYYVIKSYGTNEFVCDNINHIKAK